MSVTISSATSGAKEGLSANAAAFAEPPCNGPTPAFGCAWACIGGLSNASAVDSATGCGYRVASGVASGVEAAQALPSWFEASPPASGSWSPKSPEEAASL